MSYNYDARSSRSSDLVEVVGDILFKILLVLLAVTVLPLFLLGLFGSPFVIKHSTHPRRDWSILAALALIGLALYAHFFWPLTRPGHPFFILLVDFLRGFHHGWQWNYVRLLEELLSVWSIDFLLAPAAVCVGAVFEMARPKTIEQLAQERKRQKLAITRQASKVAERMLTRNITPDAVPVAGKSALVLGVPIEGGLASWIANRFFFLPLEQLILHAVVIGASGYGKSETLIRLAVGAAKVLG